MTTDCTICNYKSTSELHYVQLRSCISRNMLCGMMLAAIREAKGLRQEDLAEMIGRDKSTISRAENMSKTAKLETYQACADALGVPLIALFASSLDEAALLTAFSQADDRAKQFLLGTAKQAAALPPLPDQLPS